jgi:hypothetical protein
MWNMERVLAVLKEIEGISEFLAGGYDDSNGDALSWYITKINGYLARMPRLEAEAEALRNEKKGAVADEEAQKGKKDQVAATLFRESILGKSVAEQKTLKFVERLNKNTIEILHGVITQLSYEKSQTPPKMSADFKEEMMKLHRRIEKLEKTIGDKL